MVGEVKNLNQAVSIAFMKYYTAENSAEKTIYYINRDLEPMKLKEQELNYVNFCVTGLLALLSTTFPIDGYAIAVVVYYYDYYEFLLNRAKLASLQYSYSGRIALRTEEAIGE
ncbi:MAG: hypothetical protein ACI4CX_06745 [Candidatus Weimeria sp.]